MPYIGKHPSAVPVTVDDIPNNSIDASKIIDGSIQVEDVADNSITDAKLNSTKLDGIADNANKYVKPSNEAISYITGLQSAIDGKLSLTGGSLSSSLTVNGALTATSFSGDGSALTNLPAGGATSLDGLTDAINDGSSVGIGTNALSNLVPLLTLRNTAVGTDALQFNTTGDRNVASGQGAMSYNTTGGYNTASGMGTMNSNTTGADNTASGMAAMYLNTTGFQNTASGAYALFFNSGGSGNVALGYKAGMFESGSNKLYIANNGSESLIEGDFVAKTVNINGALTVNGTAVGGGGATSLDGLTDAINDGSSVGIGTNALFTNTSGSSNTAIGTSALTANTTGGHNTATGNSALQFNTTGYGNTASGMNVLRFNSTGEFNTASGYQSMLSNTTGSYSTAMGHYTLYTNTTGSSNAAIGAYALWKNTTGSYNTATGNSALQYNTTGYGNTASGKNAMRLNSTGGYNTASGYQSLSANTTGNYNTASGADALYSNTTGNENVASGKDALRLNTTGSANTATGTYTMYKNTTGQRNTATGREALYSNTSGSYNTATGDITLKDNTTGSYNTAIGMGALLSNTTGTSNTASGKNALLNNSTGIQNTANGKDAMYYNTTGSYNTVIGHQAGDNITTGSSNIIIGSGVDAPSATGSNQLNIGNWIYGSGGNVGIETSSPVNKLDVKMGNSGVHMDSTPNPYYGAAIALSQDVGADNRAIRIATHYNGPNPNLVFETSDSNFSYGTNPNVSAVTGWTERMRIDGSGRVTMPYQPSFNAYHPPKTGTDLIILWETARSNVGNHYSTSTGLFTAPIGGVYHFDFNVLMGSPYSGSYVRVLWKINGSNSTNYGDTLADSGSHGAYTSCTMGLTIALSGGDTVGVWNDGPIETYGTGYGSFSGHLIG